MKHLKKNLQETTRIWLEITNFLTNEENISSFCERNHYDLFASLNFECIKQLKKKSKTSIGAMGHAASCPGLWMDRSTKCQIDLIKNCKFGDQFNIPFLYWTDALAGCTSWAVGHSQAVRRDRCAPAAGRTSWCQHEKGWTKYREAERARRSIYKMGVWDFLVSRLLGCGLLHW